MAYSFIAITKKTQNWTEVRNRVFDPESAIEMFPIESGKKGVYNLGICIPSVKLNQRPQTWDELLRIFNSLKIDFEFEVFDLYHGFYVTDDNLHEVRNSLLGE